jgi:hypothetical protein
MKKVIAFVLVLLLLVSHASANSNLIDGTMLDWKQATMKERVLLSSIYIILMKDDLKIPTSTEASVQKHAIILKNTIDLAGETIKNVDREKITKIAAICMSSLGWIK